jgi:hypothetical protein
MAWNHLGLEEPGTEEIRIVAGRTDGGSDEQLNLDLGLGGPFISEPEAT